MLKPSPAGLIARSPRIPRILAAIVIACVLTAPAVASAATAPPFVAQLVISDDVFRASGSMTAADIQAFLERYPGVLDTTLAPRHSDGVMTPVSQLIWEVCQEFNVNPKVMLTMLQKEQGLITATAPSPEKLDWAFGFGCKDGVKVEDRSLAYKGLGNQIWYAAQALDSYANTTWTPGLKRTICTNCVTAYTLDYAFVAANLATYKLYVYTPHSHGPTPDIYGGNYLFWVVYWRYFDEGPLASPAVRPVYRFYNTSNGTHFYTASDAERYTVLKTLSKTYQLEGVAYRVNTANPQNNQPLYRFYNTKANSHFYTANEAEKANVIATLKAVYSYEGPVYSVSTVAGDATAMHRFYNRKTGTHFYTISEAERVSVIANLGATYSYEGIAYYIGN